MRPSAIAHSLLAVGCAFNTLACSFSLSFDNLSGGETTKACQFHFEPETRFPTDGYSWDVAVADFNLDKHLDLAVTRLIGSEGDNACGPQILLGDGHGSFEYWSGSSRFGLGSHSIVAGNLNGDGIPDIEVSFSSIDPSDNDGVLVEEWGDGLGKTDSGGIWTVPNADDIAIGDFNGDGLIDSAVLSKTQDQGIADEKLFVFLRAADGNLAQHRIYDKNDFADGTLNAIAAEDFDGDGKTDLMVSHWGGQALSVLMGAADGNFFIRGPFPTGEVPKGMASADFNHDGHPDIVVVNNNDNSVSILQGFGDGFFGPEKPMAMLQLPDYVVAADFDHDGNSDIVVGGDSKIALRLGTSNGDFGDLQEFPIDGTANQMTSADFNRDGVLDLAVANIARKSVSVYLGACE